MTHVIIVLDADTCIQKDYTKTADELYREIELGTFHSPTPLKDPIAVRLQNYLLVAEREIPSMLSKRQRDILNMLSMGASESEMAYALLLSFSGIRHHINALKKKFEVSTREELIAIYCRSYK